jgi:hypothetical protein
LAGQTERSLASLLFPGAYSSHAIIRSTRRNRGPEVTAAETTPIKLTVIFDYI